jgi:hypothetical protein
MFARRFFPGRYFAPRFFPPAAAAPAGPPARRYVVPGYYRARRTLRTADLTGATPVSYFDTVRTANPELRFAAGERADVRLPVTLPADVALTDFEAFELYIWADPAYPREGGTFFVRGNPAADGWTLAATLQGEVVSDTVLSFVGTLPDPGGFRSHVLAAWALGGTAGPACLVYPTWLTLVPGR